MYDDHIRYVTIYITKPYKVRNILYGERLCEFFELGIYLPPPREKNIQSFKLLVTPMESFKKRKP